MVAYNSSIFWINANNLVSAYYNEVMWKTPVGNTWFLIATLVEVISLAEGLEVGSISIEGLKVSSIPIKVVAHICDILFKEWQEWIWILHISSNASWIFM